MTMMKSCTPRLVGIGKRSKKTFHQNKKLILITFIA